MHSVGRTAAGHPKGRSEAEEPRSGLTRRRPSDTLPALHETDRTIREICPPVARNNPENSPSNNVRDNNRLLGAYCRRPILRRRTVVERRFARTFPAGTGYRVLDEKIGRTLANRDKLLAVLDRPDFPAHNNQRETDLRVCVVRRKVSGGTRSNQGRACRDAFPTHMKTCAHHAISFWSYLGDRLGIPGAEGVPWLPSLA